MKSLLWRFLVGCFFTAGMLAQQSAKQSAAPAGWQVSGTIVDGDSNQPLPGARVAIAPATEREAVITTRADADGHFIFSSLPAGRYALSAQHRGYITQNLNQHGAFATSVAVGPALDSTNLIFSMMAESAITGTVVDEEGEAIRNAQIMLFQSTAADEGSRQTRQRGLTITDHEGHYRFPHLRPGRYFIVASAQPWYAQRPQPRIKATAADGTVSTYFGNVDEKTLARAVTVEVEDGPPAPLDLTFPLTFYPGTTDGSEATPVLLGKGEKVSADFSLRPVPAAHFRFYTGTQEQPGQSYVALETKLFDGVRVQIPTTTMLVTPGMLEINGIPPGHYTAAFRSFTSNSFQVLQAREIDVRGAGAVEGGATTLVPVTATMNFEPPASASGQLSLQLREKNSGQIFNEPANSKGAVEFKQAISPGSYEVSLQGGQDLFIKSINVSGGRMMGRVLTLKGGAVKLDVLLSQGMGEVTGMALRDGKAVAGAMILLVPRDPANNRVLFRRNQSDSDGGFRLANIVPGQYTLLAIQDGWELEWAEPRVLEKYMPQGQQVNVEQRGRYSIKVKVQ